MNNELRYPGTWNLTADDRAALLLFCERAAELARFGRLPYPASTEIKLEQGELSVKAELPDEDRLRSATMTARLFYQKQELTHLFKVLNVLYKAAQDDRFRSALAGIRKSYGESLRHPISGSFRIGSQIFNTQDGLLDVFFNGHYFHSDPQYRNFTGSIEEGLGPIFKQEFVRAVISLSGHVQQIARIAENALGVDQLARAPIEKKIQGILTSAGENPTAIDVHEHQDKIYCRLDDLTMTRELDEQSLMPIFEAIRHAYPDGRVIEIHCRLPNGLPGGFTFNEEGGNEITIEMFTYDPATLKPSRQ